MSFSSPQSQQTAPLQGHATFGDHLLGIANTLSPTIGGLLGLAGVHDSRSSPSTIPGGIPVSTGPVILQNEASALPPTSLGPLPDYSAQTQQAAQPKQDGGGGLSSILKLLMVG